MFFNSSYVNYVDMLWLCLQLVVKLFIADSKTTNVLRNFIYSGSFILLAIEMLCVILVNNGNS